MHECADMRALRLAPWWTSLRAVAVAALSASRCCTERNTTVRFQTSVCVHGVHKPSRPLTGGADVFTVDVDDGVTHKLGYNRGENPYDVAQQFIYDNDLSQGACPRLPRCVILLCRLCVCVLWAH